VNGPHLRARRILEQLFRLYLDHHREVGSQARKRARRDGWPRAICDYLAGMTDRYAMLEHERLFSVTGRSPMVTDPASQSAR
jgi:dGTPase